MSTDDPATYYKPPKMIATQVNTENLLRETIANVIWFQEEMAEAKLPLNYRDFCAHLLIPLNKCRHEHFYMPWACKHELHEYEKCEYKDFKRRMLAMEKYKAAQQKKKTSD